ncbi:acetyl-coa carboxylase, partial [Chrysochromulina tobinii]
MRGKGLFLFAMLGAVGNLRFASTPRSLPALYMYSMTLVGASGLSMPDHAEKDEHAVITEILFPPVERFVPPAGIDPLFLTVWQKMDLSHVFGFPTFEQGVFALLYKSFGELASIFTFYAKSGTAGSTSANALLTIQQTELQKLALDCQLCNEQFSMTRVINVFERADRVDDTFVVSKADKRVVKGETAGGGDRGLQLHKLFECLLLDTLLNKSILKRAKSDNLAKTLKRIKKEPEVQAVFARNKPELLKFFLSKSTATHSKTANPTMTMETFVAQCVERRVCKDTIVKPETNVSGAIVPDVHSNLSQLDIKGAFMTAQGEGKDKDKIDAHEFLNILALCEEVESMSLEQQVAGVYANFLVQKEKEKAISEALIPPLKRHVPPADTDPKMLEVWKKMDLSDMFGFPMWEKVVFELTLRSFPELASIFDYYANVNIAFSRANPKYDSVGYNGKAEIDVGTAYATLLDKHVLNIAKKDSLAAVKALAKANPKFGTVGNNASADSPLLGCFETLLKKHRLIEAKTDTLAQMKKMIEKDPEVQVLELQLLLRPRKSQLKVCFDKLAKSDSTMTAGLTLMMSMEKFCDINSLDYVSAGTVEYLYLPAKKKYCFLELNPRLQVEHTVTEGITGVSLPAALIHITMGIKLCNIPEIRRFYGQDYGGIGKFDLSTFKRHSKHVIAERITAENPDGMGFKPTSCKIGRITFQSNSNLRGYFSVTANSGVHEYADSHFGHLLATHPTREVARKNLVMALMELFIMGADIRMTIECLGELLEIDAFKPKTIDTAWLDGIIVHKSAVVNAVRAYKQIQGGIANRHFQGGTDPFHLFTHATVLGDLNPMTLWAPMLMATNKTNRGITIVGIDSGMTVDHCEVAYNTDDIFSSNLSVLFMGNGTFDMFALVQPWYNLGMKMDPGTKMDSKYDITIRSLPTFYSITVIGGGASRRTGGLLHDKFIHMLLDETSLEELFNAGKIRDADIKYSFPYNQTNSKEDPGSGEKGGVPL